MIATLFALFAFLLSNVAEANNQSLKLNLGQWSTDRSLCGPGAQCVSITNISFTECVDVGFRQGGIEMQLGNMTFLTGNVATRVWVNDGPDPGKDLDNDGCIPPRTTVHGPVPAHWTIVDLDTTKYFVGDIRECSLTDLGYYLSLPNPLNPAQPLVGLFFGQYYEGTGEGLPARGVPGNPRNQYDLRNDITLVVGGR